MSPFTHFCVKQKITQKSCPWRKIYKYISGWIWYEMEISELSAVLIMLSLSSKVSLFSLIIMQSHVECQKLNFLLMHLFHISIFKCYFLIDPQLRLVVWWGWEKVSDMNLDRRRAGSSSSHLQPFFSATVLHATLLQCYISSLSDPDRTRLHPTAALPCWPCANPTLYILFAICVLRNFLRQLYMNGKNLISNIVEQVSILALLLLCCNGFWAKCSWLPPLMPNCLL